MHGRVSERIEADWRGAGRIRRVNRLLERAWARGWAPAPVLDHGSMIADARRATGLDDFGPSDHWRRNLEVLIDAVGREAAVSPLGRTMAYGQISAALRDRLRAQALWQRRPEIGGIPIARPILILGQMRSGTTRVQRLLACDPRLSHTRYFESWRPMRATRLPVDDRVWRARGMLGAMRLLNPEFEAIHPTGARRPDEEIGLFSPGFHGATFEAQWRVPSFARHCEAADARPVYAEFKQLLRTVAWTRGEREPRPWVIKVPQLTQDLHAVLDAFPDARAIRLERDPVATVASAASLVRNQMRVQSDAVDDAWIGREWLRKVKLRRERTTAALAARPETAVAEVGFDEMNRDPVAAMRGVYETLELTLTPEVEGRMRRYLRRAAREGRGAHRYRIEEFGLSEGEVRAVLPGPSTRT